MDAPETESNLRAAGLQPLPLSPPRMTVWAARSASPSDAKLKFPPVVSASGPPAAKDIDVPVVNVVVVPLVNDVVRPADIVRSLAVRFTKASGPDSVIPALVTATVNLPFGLVS